MAVVNFSYDKFGNIHFVQTQTQQISLISLTPSCDITYLNPVPFEALSKIINDISRNIFYKMREQLWLSEEHRSRLTALANEKPNYGNIDTALIMFSEASPFEQMIVFENFLLWKQVADKRYTFCVKAKFGHVIPLSIQKGAKDLMRLMLGNNSNECRAPPYYRDLDKNDPWQNKNKKFIYTLEALELVRQPDFIGATLIKGNAFESEYINEDERYGTFHQDGTPRREACVEFINQKKLNENVRSYAGSRTAQLRTIKRESAAFNLFKLIYDGLGDDADLCHHMHGLENEYVTHHDYPSEGFSMSVSPEELRFALIHNNKQDLYILIFKLFVAKIGPQSTPNLQNFISNELLK